MSGFDILPAVRLELLSRENAIINDCPFPSHLDINPQLATANIVLTLLLRSLTRFLITP